MITRDHPQFFWRQCCRRHYHWCHQNPIYCQGSSNSFDSDIATIRVSLLDEVQFSLICRPKVSFLAVKVSVNFELHVHCIQWGWEWWRWFRQTCFVKLRNWLHVYTCSNLLFALYDLRVIVYDPRACFVYNWHERSSLVGQSCHFLLDFSIREKSSTSLLSLSSSSSSSLLSSSSWFRWYGQLVFQLEGSHIICGKTQRSKAGVRHQLLVRYSWLNHRNHHKIYDNHYQNYCHYHKVQLSYTITITIIYPFLHHDHWSLFTFLQVLYCPLPCNLLGCCQYPRLTLSTPSSSLSSS